MVLLHNLVFPLIREPAIIEQYTKTLVPISNTVGMLPFQMKEVFLIP